MSSPEPFRPVCSSLSFLFGRQRNSLPRIEWPGLEINHAPAVSALVKNALNCSCTPPIRLHEMDREESALFLFIYMLCILDFCLTVHHQLGKVIQMNQLDATMIY